jgi:hypothetical protein
MFRFRSGASPYPALMHEDAPQRRYELREMFNALRWMARAGASWRIAHTPANEQERAQLVELARQVQHVTGQTVRRSLQRMLTCWAESTGCYNISKTEVLDGTTTGLGLGTNGAADGAIAWQARCQSGGDEAGVPEMHCRGNGE